MYILQSFIARSPARRTDTSVHAITSPERVVKSRPRGSSQSQRKCFYYLIFSIVYLNVLQTVKICFYSPPKIAVNAMKYFDFILSCKDYSCNLSFKTIFCASFNSYPKCFSNNLLWKLLLFHNNKLILCQSFIV